MTRNGPSHCSDVEAQAQSLAERNASSPLTSLYIYGSFAALGHAGARDIDLLALHRGEHGVRVQRYSEVGRCGGEQLNLYLVSRSTMLEDIEAAASGYFWASKLVGGVRVCSGSEGIELVRTARQAVCLGLDPLHDSGYLTQVLGPLTLRFPTFAKSLAATVSSGRRHSLASSQSCIPTRTAQQRHSSLDVDEEHLFWENFASSRHAGATGDISQFSAKFESATNVPTKLVPVLAAALGAHFIEDLADSVVRCRAQLRRTGLLPT